MQKIKQGQLVRSTAGHDKEQFYIIIGVDEEYVYLVDGKLKTLEHPKKKNRKHIAYVADISSELIKKPDNLYIKQIIKRYKKK